MISTSLDTLRRLPDSTAARHDVDPGEDSARIDRGTEREAGVGHEVGREAGGEAVLLLSVDSPVPEAVLAKANALPGVRRVKALKFGG